MTSQECTKETLEIVVNLNESVDYEPGDSFAFSCVNSKQDVDYILSRYNSRLV